MGNEMGAEMGWASMRRRRPGYEERQVMTDKHQ